jgi:hypothetical protein
MTTSTAPKPTTPESGASIVDQATTLAQRAVKAQKAAGLTLIDLYEKNTKVALGATEKLADLTPVNWAADALRKQNELVSGLAKGYTTAVRAYLA